MSAPEISQTPVSRRRSPQVLLASVAGPPPSVDEAALRGMAAHLREVMAETNKIRRQKGLRAVSWANGLAKAADVHADDMAKRNYLAHDTKGGPSWHKLIRRYYKNPAGQNIARGYSSPDAVVRAWMNSPLHRKNILNPRFRTIGVGFNSGGDYWCQNFGY